MRTVVVLCVAIVVAFAASGCGGSSSDKGMKDVVQAADRASVLDAVVVVEDDAINGGNLLLDSQQLAVRIRKAKTDGLDSGWINQQIDDTQQAVTAVNCPECYSILEGIRP